MPTNSAGILVYRRRPSRLEVFLVHPGGPFWAKKDAGAWSIPKGEFAGAENALDAARREFTEETGQTISGEFLALTPAKQKSRKIVHAFAVDGDIDADNIVSNEFELEWPPRSGVMQRFPEIDRGAWFAIADAKKRVHAGLMPILEELERLLDRREQQLRP
jgi:predicted NUDIX family NTP pyrophosphohydrolase